MSLAGPLHCQMQPIESMSPHQMVGTCFGHMGGRVPSPMQIQGYPGAMLEPLPPPLAPPPWPPPTSSLDHDASAVKQASGMQQAARSGVLSKEGEFVGREESGDEQETPRYKKAKLRLAAAYERISAVIAGGSPVPMIGCMMPGFPGLPMMPAMQGMPGIPSLSGMGGMAGVPGITVTPGMSPMQGLDVARCGDDSKCNQLREQRSKGVGKKGSKQLDNATVTPDDLTDPDALISAAEKRNEAKCKALVAHADFKYINQKSKDGRTALHVALLKKLSEDLTLSILNHESFREVDAVDEFGNTLLMLAASKGQTNLCKAILARSDFTVINNKDKWGGTALHWAADQDLGEVCEAIMRHRGFVEAGRRAFSFAFEDKTALDVAKHRNCKSAIQAIEANMP